MSREGRQLAIEMLRAMEDRSEECSMFQAAGTGSEQDNVVLRYLDTLRQAGSRDFDVGFAEVVTDFIASALDDGVARPEAYESNVIQLPGRRARPSNAYK